MFGVGSGNSFVCICIANLVYYQISQSGSTPFAIFMYEGIAYFFLKAVGFVDIKQCKLPI